MLLRSCNFLRRIKIRVLLLYLLFIWLFLLLICFLLDLMYASAHATLYKPTQEHKTLPRFTTASSQWTTKESTWSVYKTFADCKRLLNGDVDEISRANRNMKRHPKRPLTPNDYIQLAKNCDVFKNNRRYIQKVMNKKERDFPIAYAIIIHKDVEQFERLLRAIYRPQNFYCVHVDVKCPQIFHSAVELISRCFPNVMIATRSVDVKWGYFSVLEAQLICLKDLLTRFNSWKYFINLAGQEFPLKTNAEIVQDLMNLNGKSLVIADRPKKSYIERRVLFVHHGAQPIWEQRKRPFQHKFTFFKGLTYVILARDFANFSLTNHVAKEFLEWLKDTGNPDETFYPSLYANFWVPGSSLVFSDTKMARKLIRHVVWHTGCEGKIVRQVCILGIKSLKRLINRRELFVNKFHLDFEYIALDCMEQWLYNKTLNEFHEFQQRSATTFH